MKNTFTMANLPSITFLDADNFKVSIPCTVYGCYKGRENEDDMEILYLNKEVNNRFT